MIANRGTQLVLLLVVLAAAGSLVAAEGQAPPSIGWRGNQTGLFPDAKVPMQWSLVSTGPLEGLKAAATSDEKDAAAVEGGLIGDWLVVGPFEVKDGSADFAKELVPGEATVAPKPGDKAGEHAWATTQPKTDGVSFKSVNAGGGKGSTNQGGLATACLWSKKAGKLRAVIEHPVPVKVFVNGKEVYSNEKYGCAVGSAYGQSSNRVAMTWPVAPSFEFDVKEGLNRITVKLVSSSRPGWNDLVFMLRLSDLPDVKYERKNILWETPLNDHGHGAPIIVGDRVFVTAEPDEMICIDKNTGKVLWTATNTYWDAMPDAERAANPAFKEKVEPAAKELADEKDPVKRWAARKKVYDALRDAERASGAYKGKLDPLTKAVAEEKDPDKLKAAKEDLDKAYKEIDKKYTMNFDGHLAGHFEIVGFTNTPVSDGKNVYFWNGAGVAACYTPDGKRVWIRRLEADKLFYSCAPAIIAGKLAVYFGNAMQGLDAATGQTAWKQPACDKNVASFLSARLAGVDVFVSQQGEVVRASDGKVLWGNPHKITNDTGWAPPTIIGEVMYVPWYGTQMIWMEDFTGCTGEDWKPKEQSLQGFGAGFPPLPKAPMGIGRDATAGSPLIHDGLAYVIDWCGGYYVYDIKAGKTLAYREVGLKGDASYVSMPVAASCTLVGKNILVMDNQGTTVVLEPGAECKVVATNRIAMQVPRDWAITTQEYTTYTPPVVDGNRMYIRGERHLYCIGEK